MSLLISRERIMIDEVHGLMRLRALIDGSTLEQPIREELLLCFLRARKFNVERAFKSLKNYLKMVKNYPELLSNLSVSKLRPQLKEQLQIVYKSRDKLGRRIFIFRAGRWNPNKLSLDDIFRCNVFCLQQLASNFDAQMNGIVAIVDLQNLSLHQARHFTPGYAKKIADLLTEAFPLSFQTIHIVNQNWIVDMLMSIIWPFLSAKIQKRVLYHGSCWASLHEYVAAADLPEDYGGFREQLDCFKLSDAVTNEETCNLFNLN
ncbi:hypothetical protein GHT06_009625 [Daphnia sinensis]|uniref:CRAL-TRIO domain-containing protein n=1 Tax=Daphnia sinensis TaxID=1820382 RepID=A0AAD5Q3U9_9CRUS|nr:hypothetical protein GHT06_009625 [Daphnia sinensis]